MDLKCPGKTANAAKDSIIIRCPSCRRDVELFGDEQRVHCRCGQWIFREILPSCARWCPAAQECLGSVASLAQLMDSAGASPDQEIQKARLHDLQEKISKARIGCSLFEARKEDQEQQ